MMKAIIVEDEVIAARRLKYMLQDLDRSIKITGVFSGVQETIDYLAKEDIPELIFLDIHLADGNAFDLIQRVSIQSPIIFTTAYDDYVEKAFDVNAFDYLLKPIRKNELRESLDRVKMFNPQDQPSVSQLNLDKEPSFLIRFGSKYHAVKIKDIAYIYYTEGITIIVDKSGKHLPCNLSLATLINQINDVNFCHIDDKLILHINALKKITNHEVPGKIELELHPAFNDKMIINNKQYTFLKQWLDAK